MMQPIGSSSTKMVSPLGLSASVPQNRGDFKYETDETFALALSNASGALLGANGIGTIRNDDAIPSAQITGGSVTEGNTGTRPITFVVTLSNPSHQTITIDYATANGTLPTTRAREPSWTTSRG
jgi:hypothetical protein